LLSGKSDEGALDCTKMGDAEKSAPEGQPVERNALAVPPDADPPSALAPSLNEPPDVGKLLLSWIWQPLVRWVGFKWAIALFVTGFVLFWARPHLGSLSFIPTFIAEHLPLPKANPNVFTVTLVPLDNDADGQIEHDIVEGLKEVHGIDVMQFKRKPISDSDVNAGNALARRYLKQSGAEVLIWGTLLTQGGTTVPKLYWTVSGITPEKESGRYPLAQTDLSLPPTFTKDLNDLLRLLVVTQGVPFYGEQGNFISGQLTPFIARTTQLLAGSAGQGWSPLDATKARRILADAQDTLGEQSGQNQPLLDAINNYQKILSVDIWGSAPEEWAKTENNLGLAFTDLGERESSTAHLQQAITAYQAALKFWTQYSDPADWATAENNLGIALDDLGEREPSTEHLQQAISAYQAALHERTRDRVPMDWAMTETNLGVALARLGERESGTKHLLQAVAAFNQALSELRRDLVPIYWAATENNLGDALLNVGERESGTEHLRQAIDAYEEALQEWTRNRDPLAWAMAENNLGNALTDLGERESDVDRLQQAVAAYQAALQERTRNRVPLDWAATEDNLGNALDDLGERKSKIEYLQQAVTAYRVALQVRTRDHFPLDWAASELNLGYALTDLGEKENDPSQMCEAIQAEFSAWTIFADTDSYGASKAVGNTRRVLARLENGRWTVSEQCLKDNAQALARMGIALQ
jgi:tetratricopeptide (TPR) repeat protein